MVVFAGEIGLSSYSALGRSRRLLYPIDVKTICSRKLSDRYSACFPKQ